jgi:hypothetical protein
MQVYVPLLGFTHKCSQSLAQELKFPSSSIAFMVNIYVLLPSAGLSDGLLTFFVSAARNRNVLLRPFWVPMVTWNTTS